MIQNLSYEIQAYFPQQLSLPFERRLKCPLIELEWFVVECLRLVRVLFLRPLVAPLL